jgi:hypothetical protein
MSDELTPGEVNALEAALGSLKPQAGLVRDALMFRAGQESMRSGRWTWPTVAAASWVLALGLATLLAVRSPAERVVYVQVERVGSALTAAPTSPAPAAVEPSAYIKVRYQVLHEGAESLPPPPPVPLPTKGNDPADF